MKTIWLIPFRVFSVFAAALGSQALGQGTEADYARSDGLRERYRNRVFRAEVNPQWIDSHRAWYRVETAPDAHEFVLVDAQRGVRELAFDHQAISEVLARQLEERIVPKRLAMDALEFAASGELTGFRYRGDRYTRGALTWEREAPAREEARPPRREGRGKDLRGHDDSRLRSPDGKWRVEIRSENVWLVATESDEALPLSFDGNEGNRYLERVYWAPNSSRFVVVREKPAQEHVVHMVESTPEEQLQPKLHSMDYLKPGDQVAVQSPQLFEVATRSQIPVDDGLFSNPYHLRDYQWAEDSREFYFVYNQRGHQVLRVVGVDGFTGQTRAVVNEVSETFIDYAYKQYRHLIDATDELIWMSERDGWNHLYLYDIASGSVKHQVTAGEWVVRRVDHVDEDARQIWFQASGIYPDQDPYFLHACRINFDGTGLVILTAAEGTHRFHYSPDRSYLIATHSRVDLAPVTELRDGRSGRLIRVLEQSSLKALREQGWQTPERFVAKGRDGQTDIHGVIYRPSHFSEDASYPVVEHIYAGPHGSHVPKRFSAYRSSQATAELGFIVVRIDGMGTSNRSKAFHDVCWRNLKDAGFPDRILWMKAAAERYPSMDITRVGIYGGSAGGQNTVSALLHYPEFYDVGIADCGCHDNRMDKIWWNELWMGWPIGPHYEANSNRTHANQLEGKLLLTVGELDRNVDPASTLQLVDALVKADKDFDFVMIPGGGHGVGDGMPYLVRRRQDFLVRHLHGVEPRRALEVAQVPDDVRRRFQLDPFYAKHIDNDGFPIVSSVKVADEALREADYLIDQMLTGREDVRQGLVDLNFRFSVMAVDEYTTDIPEHADLSPQRFWDRRARGLGATRHRPSVSCGEENLLQYPGDPYDGESILIHEFAHAMHEAIRVLDKGFDDRLEAIYQRAMDQGLWKGKYAATNRYEYWAECVQSYFDDNRENDRSHNHVDTREELREYDEAIYELIRETFRDNPWRYVPPKQRSELAHLEGFNRALAPNFEWPEHLKGALDRNRSDSGQRMIEIVEREIEGWTVDVDIQLLEGFDEALGARVLALLKHQLFGVGLLMPKDRLEKLRQVRIRLDRDNPTLKGIQYHPSRRWLEDHGHDPRLAKVVHVPQAAAFVSRSLSAAQPWVILHELAHAYHDQILGFDHPPIVESFRRAQETGQYEQVRHIGGSVTQHYALTDPKEYFAEATEAYFGANDFFPFVRAELAEHDPTLYAILREIWGGL